MTNEVILMKLLGISEEVRQKHRDKHKKERETRQCDWKNEEEWKKKHHHKMSPVAQNTLCLLLKEGAMNQRTIAKNSRVTGQAVSEVMKKLEARELITRQQGEQNNENIISLTEKGREKAVELQEKMSNIAETLLLDFSQQEREQLFSLLEKIEKNQEIFREKLGEERENE